MLINEFEDFKTTMLKDFNFKYNNGILFKILKNYDEKTVTEAFENIVTNSPRLYSLNITYELQDELRDKKTIHSDKLSITYHCEICKGKGLITMLNAEHCDYAFLCNCSNGTRKKQLYPKLTFWNGKEKQFLNDTEFILADIHKIELADIKTRTF